MKDRKFKVMFVCMGNICRSPAAHAVLENKLKERSLEERISVESSGTIAYHVGERADTRMREELTRHGVSSSNRSKQFKQTDFEEYDLILAMDSENYRNLKQIADGAGASKLRMFRDFDPEGPGDVPDPYYGGRQGFTLVYEMVDRTVERLLDRLEAGELSP